MKKLAIAVIAFLSVQGCFSLLTGIKEIDTGKTKYRFITGADFHIGANGIDTVNDRKTIKPN